MSNCTLSEKRGTYRGYPKSGDSGWRVAAEAINNHRKNAANNLGFHRNHDLLFEIRGSGRAWL
jgi:hypothetical protein